MRSPQVEVDYLGGSKAATLIAVTNSARNSLWHIDGRKKENASKKQIFGH
jgi:hypothetical protein